MMTWRDLANTIDWKAKQSPYGNASHIPEVLQRLTDTQPQDSMRSPLRSLYTHLHPDGDIFDSTVAAVPVLALMLSDEDVHDRAGIATFLGSVAENGQELARNDALRSELQQVFMDMILPLLNFFQDSAPSLRASLCFTIANAILLCGTSSRMDNAKFNDAIKLFERAIDDEIGPSATGSLGMAIAIMRRELRMDVRLSLMRDIVRNDTACVPICCKLLDWKVDEIDAVKLLRDYILTSEPASRFWRLVSRRGDFPWYMGDVDSKVHSVTLVSRFGGMPACVEIACHEVATSFFYRSYRFSKLLAQFLNGFNLASYLKEGKGLTSAELGVLRAIYANESFWNLPRLQDNFLLTALGVSENINGRLEIASILDE